MNYFKFFFILLMFSYKKVVSQNSTYFGEIVYAKESYLSSGSYEEKNTITVYFNKTNYSFSNTNRSIDTNKMVENSLNIIKSKFENDSIGLERIRKQSIMQIKKQLENQNFNSSVQIEYINNIAKKNRFIDGNKYCVIDTLGKIDWQLQTDTTTIEGLLCQKARGWFVGKYYTVWFAPSIPYAAGPVNMHGLPGIIVLATSEDNKTRYRMKRVEYPLQKNVEMKSCDGDQQISNNDFMLLQSKSIEKIKQRAEDIKNHAQKREN